MTLIFDQENNISYYYTCHVLPCCFSFRKNELLCAVLFDYVKALRLTNTDLMFLTIDRFKVFVQRPLPDNYKG